MTVLHYQRYIANKSNLNKARDFGHHGTRYSYKVYVLHLGETQRRIGTSKAEAVGQRYLYVLLLRGAGDIITVKLFGWVARSREIERWRKRVLAALASAKEKDPHSRQCNSHDAMPTP